MKGTKAKGGEKEEEDKREEGKEGKRSDEEEIYNNHTGDANDH